MSAGQVSLSCARGWHGSREPLVSLGKWTESPYRDIEILTAQAVDIAAGDLATFPDGMTCIWDVKKPINKHYNFS